MDARPVDPASCAPQKVSLDKVMEVTSRRARRRPAAVLRRRGDRHRRVRRDAEPAAQRPHTSADREPDDLAAGRRRAPRRRASCASATWRRSCEGRQPLIGDAVVNGGPGLMLVVEKLQGANTLERHQGRRGGARRTCGPACRRDDRHDDLPARRLHRDARSTTSTPRCCIGCLLVVLVLVAFLFEWRAALISLVAIPLSLVAAGVVLTLRGATINTMMLAGLRDRGRRGRRRRDHRRREHRRAGCASTAPRGERPSRRAVDPRGVARGAGRDRLRDADQRRRRACRCSSSSGLIGRVLPPLALSYALAVLVSLVVALTVTPALSLILLSRGGSGAASRRSSRGLKRGYAAVLSPRDPRARPGVRGRRRSCCSPACVVAPRLGEELFPSFKERDFLMHWITKPGTSSPEERRIVTRGAAGSCAHARRAQLRLAHRPGVPRRGDRGRRTSARTGSASTRTPTTTRRPRPHPGGRRRLPGPATATSRPTCASGSTRSLDRRERADRGAHLRPRPRRPARRPRTGSQHVARGRPRHRRARTPRCRPTCPRSRSRRARRRPPLRPQAGRRAPRRRHAGGRRGGRRHLPAAASVVRRQVWSTPDDARQPDGDPQPPDRHARAAGRCALADVADVAIRPTPNVIQRENTSRRIDVGADVPKGRDLGAVTRRRPGRGCDRMTFPLGYHAELLGEAAERQKRPAPAADASRSSRRSSIFLLLQAAFGSWRLAALMFLTLPMALVGGVLAAYAGGGVISLGSLVGFSRCWASPPATAS